MKWTLFVFISGHNMTEFAFIWWFEASLMCNLLFHPLNIHPNMHSFIIIGTIVEYMFVAKVSFSSFLSAHRFFPLAPLSLLFSLSPFIPPPLTGAGDPAGRSHSAWRLRWCFNCHFLLRRPWHSRGDGGEAVSVIRGNGEKESKGEKRGEERERESERWHPFSY